MIEAQFKIWQIEDNKEQRDVAELIKRLLASEHENRRLKAENDRLKIRIYDLTEGARR